MKRVINRPTTALEETRESQSLGEASRRAEGHPKLAPDDDRVEYPTWRFAADGRTTIVNSPQELEELEAGGGDWQDKPHPAGTEFVPNAVRTFASPVGTVDPRGAIARTDRPLSELALTTALPRNVAESVPSGEGEARQRQANAGQRHVPLPSEGAMARLQARVGELERENGDLKRKHATQRAAPAPKKSHKKKKSSGDARTDARQQAEEQARQDNAARADAQSRAHAAK